VLSILMVLLVLAIWMTRPPPTEEWLGLAGLGNVRPVNLIGAWIAGRLAPMTPLGFLALFPVLDLGILAALLLALVILFILLADAGRDRGDRTGLNKPITPVRLLPTGMKVWTVLVLIAVIGLELGWEIVAWRSWHWRERYRLRMANYAGDEDRYKGMLKYHESLRARLDSDSSAWDGDTITPAARAADRAWRRDRWRKEYDYYLAAAAMSSQLRHKYELAIADPLRVVPRDPPPLEPDFDLSFYSARREYARALAGYDELIRHYPDLPLANERRAWILATCPDSRIRNGRLAVAAGTRAAELTNWKDWNVLATLAAAYAEAGDWPNAVRWQESAIARVAASAPGANWGRDRLALYKAAKPFHEK
jgi:tetratricopeptide (TPR) repeat protein